MSATLHLEGHLAVIRIDNPPVNGLSHAVRSAISAHVKSLQDQDQVKAILLMGSDKAFSGGADIKEFGTDKTFAEPSLPQLVGQLEESEKPIVAVINGICMGGGLELAMACHYRVGTSNVQISLPEVKLGIMPGAGGTQRLPRLLDMETSTFMIINGNAVPTAALPSSALFDLYVEDAETIVSRAKQFALGIADIQPIPKVSEKPVNAPAFGEFFAMTRAGLSKKSKHFPAPFACVDVLEASLHMSFEDGMANERKHFIQLLQSPESKALRHIFMAERAAGKIVGVTAEVQKRSINSVGVIGAGTMGSGIAMCFANAGIPVKLLDTQKASLEKGLARIQAYYQSAFDKGRIPLETAERNLALITGGANYEELSQVDLVVEAVFEDMGVKASVFKALDRVLKPGAIFASNTSTLDLNEIANFTKRPQDVIGLHFFSPANIMELLEIVRGRHTSNEVLATCAALAKTIKKTAVVSGVCDGFIGNRMLEQYTKQAAFLLEEGCTPEQVDKAIEAFGFAMGPFRVSDLAGNDISWAIRKRRRVANPDVVYSRLADILCERGRFGQKTQAGWYDYQANDRTAIPSESVNQFIKQYAKDLGVPQRQVSDEEIVQRLIFALANEGRKILKDGIAARASDIDIVYLKGYGFPRHRGGPMFYAESLGWDFVQARISAFAQGHRGATW